MKVAPVITIADKTLNSSPTEISVGKTFNNFYIIDLVDNVLGKLIYNVQCICGSIGKISEIGLRTTISCGCTNIIGSHKIGLTVRCCTFVKFLGDKNGKHMYEIHCNKCNQNSEVISRYRSRLCPKCPKEIKMNGIYIELGKEADKIGIHPTTMRARLALMPPEEAFSKPKTNRGGKKGIHGDCYFQNMLDSVPNHLKRIGMINRKGFVYYWVRRGFDPSVVLQMVIDGVNPNIIETESILDTICNRKSEAV